MNEFIESNIPAMKNFLDQVSTVFASTPRNNSPRQEDQQVRAGAALLRYVERAGPDLFSLSTDPVTPQQVTLSLSLSPSLYYTSFPFRLSFSLLVYSLPLSLSFFFFSLFCRRKMPLMNCWLC